MVDRKQYQQYKLLVDLKTNSVYRMQILIFLNLICSFLICVFSDHNGNLARKFVVDLIGRNIVPGSAHS